MANYESCNNRELCRNHFKLIELEDSLTGVKRSQLMNHHAIRDVIQELENGDIDQAIDALKDIIGDE